MRFSSRALTIVLALLLGRSSLVLSLQAATTDDIQKLQEQWRTALVAANIDALEAIYSDDLVYVHSDGRIQNKGQYLAPIKAGTLRFTSLTECDMPRIHAYEQAAVVSACYELRIGASQPSRHQFMTTYVNERGKWRIAAIQTTRLPDKP
jgi:ketosteroid isomerase-like protein